MELDVLARLYHAGHRHECRQLFDCFDAKQNSAGIATTYSNILFLFKAVRLLLLLLLL